MAPLARLRQFWPTYKYIGVVVSVVLFADRVRWHHVNGAFNTHDSLFPIIAKTVAWSVVGGAAWPLAVFTALAHDS